MAQTQTRQPPVFPEFARAIGCVPEYLIIDEKLGRMEAIVTPTDQHRNTFRLVSGGMIGSVFDLLAEQLFWRMAPHGAVTEEAKIYHPRSCRIGQPIRFVLTLRGPSIPHPLWRARSYNIDGTALTATYIAATYEGIWLVR